MENRQNSKNDEIKHIAETNDNLKVTEKNENEYINKNNENENVTQDNEDEEVTQNNQNEEFQTEKKNKDKNLKKPTNNLIKVNSSKDIKFWEFLTKVYLKYFEEVEIIAFGKAVHFAIKSSHNIIRKELGDFIKVETFNSKDNNQKKKSSIKIIIKRKPHFFKKTSKLILVK